MHIREFIASLVHKQSYPRIPVPPVQLDVIQPLLKRAATPRAYHAERHQKSHRSH
jgi:hypothetical protein